MAHQFTKKFNDYVCVGDTIEVEIEDYRFVARIAFDDDSDIDDDDCHSTDQSVTGCDDEQFAKLLENRIAWQNDQWFYGGVVVAVYYRGYLLDEYAASLWAIACNYPDSDNEHLTEVANELLPEAIKVAKDHVTPTTEELMEFIKIQIPLVHLNGTSEDDLVDQNIEAGEAIDQVVDAIRKAAPNGRDYYPLGDKAFQLAITNHERRLSILAQLKREYALIVDRLLDDPRMVDHEDSTEIMERADVRPKELVAGNRRKQEHSAPRTRRDRA
jgi:hypothetical protein